MTMFYFIAQATMIFMIPLMVVALGGLFSEKSGVVNIALEGKMILGAFTGIFFINRVQLGYISFLPEFLSAGNGLLAIALVIAAATGIVIALLHAYAAINLRANQIISGVAINMFAYAFAVYVTKQVTGTQNLHFVDQFRIRSVPLLGDIPVVGNMFFQGTYFTTYLGFVILALSVFVLYKTKFGLRLRACGEHPQAADSVGISVAKIRYAGVLLSGGLAGLGGLIYIVPITTVFNGSVSGYGFLALAVLIFGGWRPMRVLFAAFFFGIMQAIAASWSEIPFLFVLGLPGQFFRAVPYVATLIVLAFMSKNTMAPKAVGIPYDKGSR
ncbi:MAG: ABC transporter permease [Oscillospiraceae bacterium]|nr:ABC transporter permease [Oscillospiraceae bacterium]